VTSGHNEKRGEVDRSAPGGTHLPSVTLKLLRVD
jgi:hypothetical protein